jgi:hypothetical protein
MLTTAPASEDPRLAESLEANLVDNGLRHNMAGGQVEMPGRCLCRKSHPPR